MVNIIRRYKYYYITFCFISIIGANSNCFIWVNEIFTNSVFNGVFFLWCPFVELCKESKDGFYYLFFLRIYHF